MAEGAGAAGLAAMLARPERFAGRRWAGAVPAANTIAHSRLGHVRELERETASSRSGSPSRPSGVLGATRRGSVSSAQHPGGRPRRLFLDVPAKARARRHLEVRDAAHADAILTRFRPRVMFRPASRPRGDGVNAGRAAVIFLVA